MNTGFVEIDVQLDGQVDVRLDVQPQTRLGLTKKADVFKKGLQPCAVSELGWRVLLSSSNCRPQELNRSSLDLLR
jgi:hypothetical protein